MMGKQIEQLSMRIVDISSLIPEQHLLKKINRMVDFEFIYAKAEPYYARNGRPSTDPVSLIKMLLVGYLYGIRSERRLEEEVTLNIAYRWFCGFSMMDCIPDHSTFSQNRRRRFDDNELLREIFNEIIMQCIDQGLVTGEAVVSDGSFLPGNVSEGSKTECVMLVEKSTVKYMEALDAELSAQPGYRESEPMQIEKTVLSSSTDEDCGYIHQERKKGLGYLTEMTVDTAYGIITGVDCYPANRRESDIILDHIQRQMTDTGIEIEQIALDAGYDVGAVHRGLELLDIIGYCSAREIHNHAMKKGFEYEADYDRFRCMQGKALSFYRVIYKKMNQGYYRLYRISRKECAMCPYLAHCSIDRGAVRINASPFYPAYYRNRVRCETQGYQKMKRLRSIWSEGTFAALKNWHNLKRIRKKGISRASEECLLVAIALNLKRMAGVNLFHFRSIVFVPFLMCQR